MTAGDPIAAFTKISKQGGWVEERGPPSPEIGIASEIEGGWAWSLDPPSMFEPFNPSPKT